jgi:MFS family permease
MSLSLPLITVGNNIVILFTAAAIIGVAQACVFPSTLTLVSNSMGKDSIGTGLGLLGTLKNAGKVVGPTISGAMIHWIGYNLTFQIMALTLILVAILIIKPPDFLKSHFKSQALP